MDDLTRNDILMMSQDNKIALIYSRSELNLYLLELIFQGESQYIHKGSELAQYQCIEDAKKAAKKNGVKKYFMCLDLTYDELGAAEATSRRFSYMEVV